MTIMDDGTEDIELAILLEDYQAFDDEAHRARLRWTNDGRGGDYKPLVINGRRSIPGGTNNAYEERNG